MKKEVKKANVKKEDLKEALIKKALGYDATETVEEYAEGEEGVRLLKKKITTKNVPPDITAIKILLTDGEKTVEELTDEELEKERIRLLKILAEQKE